MREYLFTFDLTGSGGYWCNVVKITDKMLYRYEYKKASQFKFEGKKFTVYCMFQTSVLPEKRSVLAFVSQYIEKHIVVEGK